LKEQRVGKHACPCRYAPRGAAGGGETSGEATQDARSEGGGEGRGEADASAAGGGGGCDGLLVSELVNFGARLYELEKRRAGAQLKSVCLLY
jgi:hypothetical protein